MGEYGLMQCVRPALLLRKPLEKGLSIAQNVQKYGTGALNIDACRFGYGDDCWVGDTGTIRDPRRSDGSSSTGTGVSVQFPAMDYREKFAHHLGRWPANLYQCNDDDTNLLNTIDNTHEDSNMTKDLWADMPNAKILHGDCMELLKSLPDNSIDAIVTDPPYGMSGDGIMRTWADLEEGHNVKGFMGKSWDSAVPCHNFFAECLRVIKHGGHMIAFSSTRTVCALGMAAQQGGWRVRDMLHWCYFSGFPKSHNVSTAIDREAGAVREVVGIDNRSMPSYHLEIGQTKESKRDITKPATQDAQRWDGFGTALKPAVEPALLLRKPLEQGLTIAQNVLKHGTGALNIDGCRFGYGDPCWIGPKDLSGLKPYTRQVEQRESQAANHKHVNFTDHPQGRWPANLYQCPKASRSEREEGLDHLEGKSGADVVDRKEGSAGLNNPRAGAGRTARTFGTKTCIKCGRKAINISGQCECDDPVFVHEHRYKDGGVRNIHPTVKPIKLMRWCCRLIGGQKGSTILDPFAGSGTTLIAGILEGFDVVGMEMTDDYLPIIEGRVQWAKEQYKIENAQLSLFGGDL